MVVSAITDNPPLLLSLTRPVDGFANRGTPGLEVNGVRGFPRVGVEPIDREILNIVDFGFRLFGALRTTLPVSLPRLQDGGAHILSSLNLDAEADDSDIRG